MTTTPIRVSHAAKQSHKPVGPLRSSSELMRLVKLAARNILLSGLWRGISIVLAATSIAEADAFPNGFPTDPAFFPIGVWLQSPANALEFKALGINTFVGLWNGPTEDQLSALARSEMFVISNQSDVAFASANQRTIKAWIQDDEPDNAQPNGQGGYGPCISANVVAARSRALKSRDPTRPVMVNFGQGIANPGWIGRGACTGDLQYYNDAIKDADILSFDIYPIASDDSHVRGKLEYIANGVDNLVNRIGPGQRVWAAIQTTQIQSKNEITPDQLRNEVWSALVHGATGIIYFVHEWTGGFREDGIFRHPAIAREVREVDRTIQALAPVLNSVSVARRVFSNMPGIFVMVKKTHSRLFIFASSTLSTSANARLSVAGVGDRVVFVVDENRTVSLVNGKLSDNFEAYGAHIYEILL